MCIIYIYVYIIYIIYSIYIYIIYIIYLWMCLCFLLIQPTPEGPPQRDRLGAPLLSAGPGAHLRPAPREPAPNEGHGANTEGDRFLGGKMMGFWRKFGTSWGFNAIFHGIFICSWEFTCKMMGFPWDLKQKMRKSWILNRKLRRSWSFNGILMCVHRDFE